MWEQILIYFFFWRHLGLERALCECCCRCCPCRRFVLVMVSVFVSVVVVVVASVIVSVVMFSLVADSGMVLFVSGASNLIVTSRFKNCSHKKYSPRTPLSLNYCCTVVLYNLHIHATHHK